jgi:hypothetical protein
VAIPEKMSTRHASISSPILEGSGRVFTGSLLDILRGHSSKLSRQEDLEVRNDRRRLLMVLVLLK